MGYADDYICEAGATIVGRKGSINNPIFVETRFWNVDTAFGFSPKEGISPKYLYFFCKGFNFQALNKGTTIPSLVKTDLLQITIPVPPIPEQQRIVEILDQEFAKIDALKANAEKSLQAAKDLFQTTLLQKIEGTPGTQQVELNEITEICLGLTHTPKYVENGVPFVSVKDISSGELDLSTTKRISEKEFRDFPYGAKPQKGDVLFCRVGTIGKPMILDEDTPFGIFVSVGFFRPYKEKVLNSFLKYWMMSPIFERQVEKNVVGSTLKNLNTGWLKHFSVPLPQLEQQRQIVEKLDLLYRKNTTIQQNYQKTLALCDDLKQALLRKAFNGEL